MSWDFFESFGDQVISKVGGGTTGLTDRQLWDTITGTSGIDTASSLFGNCPWYFIPGAAATAQNLQRTISSQKPALCFWIKVGAGTPSAVVRLARIVGTSHDLRLSTTRTLQVGPAGANFVDVCVLAPDTPYFVCLAADCSTNPHTVTASVYNSVTFRRIAQVATTVATAAATQTGINVGTGGANTGCDVRITGASYNSDSTPGTFIPRRTIPLFPNGDGTHVFTAGDFQDNASAPILVAATTVHNLVDEFPPGVTDFVKQVVLRTTAKVLIAFDDLPGSGISGTIDAVNLRGAFHPVGGNAPNQSQMHLNDGGTETAEAVFDATTATDTIEYRMHTYNVRPNGGGSFDTASVNALLGGFGYSGDISPPPALDAILLEALVACTQGAGRKIRPMVV